MTLFAKVSAEDSVFHQTLEYYFDGELDNKTINFF